MPSSPRTPRRSQHSHKRSVDTNHRATCSHSRTSSRGSIQPSATSPINVTDESFEDLSAAQYRTEEGHGNLADELAEALDEDDEEETTLERPLPTSKPVPSASSPLEQDSGLNRTRDSPGRDSSHSLDLESDDASSEGEYDDSSMAKSSSSLDIYIGALGKVAKEFQASTFEDYEWSFVTFAQSLRDLPTQSAIENGTSRLITTHVALTSHVANQTRSIQSLVHPLISPVVASPYERDIEGLVPLITDVIAAMPLPGGQCLTALNLLRTLTIDLAQTLTYLSDSIYMMRQNLSSASRRLRTVADMVDEMKRETDAKEEAMMWIEKGQWDRKLLDRQCGHVCGEVIEGFEEVCQGWRQRLLAGCSV